MANFIGWACFVWFVFVSSVVSAQTKIKFSLAAPEKTPWASYAHDISNKVNQLTKGSLDIQVFSGSQLGNEQDVIRQIAKGRIQLGAFSNTAASLMVPEIALLAAPYLWENLSQADCALDEHLIPIFQKKFDAKGLIILGWTEVGNMGYAFMEPVVDLAGVSGKKIRVAPTKASSITADGFGANSVVLPITEVASALQTGLVEGADLPGLAFTSLGFSKIARYWISSNHSHQVGLVLINKNLWNSLSKTERAALSSAIVSPVQLRLQVRNAEKALFAKFIKNGGNLITFDELELKSWQEAAVASRVKLVKEIGGDADSVFRRILEAKKACSG